MTRLLRAGFALLALSAILAGSAGAQTVASHLVSLPLRFRTTGLATNLSADKRARIGTGTTAYVDSTLYTRSTAGGNDTTAAISTVGMPQPQYLSGAVGPDTSFFGRLVVYEAGGAPDAAAIGIIKGVDSVYVTVQVSGGGLVPRWTTTASAVAVPFAVADTSTGRVGTYKFSHLSVASNAYTTNFLNLKGWPLIRFIVQNDSNTATSYFSATWNYYTTKPELNDEQP